jgi:hypothetical protein
MSSVKQELKKKERSDKVKVDKIEDEDEGLRKYKAITEMVRKLIDTFEKGEKLDFMQVTLDYRD